MPRSPSRMFFPRALGAACSRPPTHVERKIPPVDPRNTFERPALWSQAPVSHTQSLAAARFSVALRIRRKRPDDRRALLRRLLNLLQLRLFALLPPVGRRPLLASA